ncbi:uncharacterized protein LOC130748077 [Lotus japonicus]|uniref:uncharacterized protein LOC130748077 n=1 Tax=Lotus japonicus TaxID=34305 RepID=UPI00258A14BB|nr:uncharacterized protein LOC130748077 [Lotus japonicus]
MTKYSTVKTQILLMDPLPALNKVFSLVVQQERQIFGEQGTLSQALAVAGRGGRNFRNNNARNSGFNAAGRGSYGRGKGIKICSHCGIPGHTVDTCYKKHGPPPHLKSTKQNQDHGYANAVYQNNNSDVEKDESPKDEVQSHQTSFTAEQYQGLMALLQQSKINNNASNQVSVVPSTSSVQKESSHSGQEFIEDDWFS